MAASEPTGSDAGALFPIAAPLAAAGQGAGWAKLAAAVAAEVPPAEIETIYIFRPIKRQGREGGAREGGTDARESRPRRRRS